MTACGGSDGDADSDSTAMPVEGSAEEAPDTPNPDTQSPDSGVDADGGFAITSRTPAPGAEQRALVAEVAVEFSIPPLSETVSDTSAFLLAGDSRVPVERRHSEGSRTLILVPEEPLNPNQEYQVQLTDDLMSRDGHTLETTAWSFSTAGNIGTTPQEVIDQCMSASDIEMLSRVNNTRSSARTCGDRSMAAAEPLAWHCTIRSAAEIHSDDMAGNDFFSHTGSDGSSAGDRMYNAGYDWQAWAENIAAGQQSVRQVVKELVDSPGHCVNIMNPRFTEMGAASVTNPNAYYRRYWTQNFGRPRRSR